MLGAEEIDRIVRRYAQCLTDGDPDGVLALFAEDARVRDPADEEAISGRTALRALFARAASSVVDMQITGPVRVTNDGRSCAVPLRVLLEMDGSRLLLDSIDVFEFDPTGRIGSMMGYWGVGNMHPE